MVQARIFFINCKSITGDIKLLSRMDGTAYGFAGSNKRELLRIVFFLPNYGDLKPLGSFHIYALESLKMLLN